MAEVAQAKSDLQFLWKGLDNCPAPFSYIQSILRYCRIDVLRPSVHACRQVPHASKSLPQKEVCNLTGSIPRTATTTISASLSNSPCRLGSSFMGMCTIFGRRLTSSSLLSRTSRRIGGFGPLSSRLSSDGVTSGVLMKIVWEKRPNACLRKRRAYETVTTASSLRRSRTLRSIPEWFSSSRFGSDSMSFIAA